ncbi:27159_t:CDS:1, partial [Dentiscutata erythropus]
DSDIRNSTKAASMIWSKLLFTHQNIHKISKNVSKAKGLSSTDLNNSVLLSGSVSSKHVRVEDDDDSIESNNVLSSVDGEYSKSVGVSNSINIVQNDEIEAMVKKENSQGNANYGSKKKIIMLVILYVVV